MGRGDAQPRLYTWKEVAAGDVQNAQEAFAASMHIHPCGFEEPPLSLTVTWLVTGPEYGCVLVRAECGANQHKWLFLLALKREREKDTGQHRWVLQVQNGKGGFIGRTEHDYIPPLDIVETVPFWQPPAWLPLPPDNYWLGLIDLGPFPSSIAYLWYTATREFMTCRVAMKADKPSHARTITLSGYAGWITEANGITAVVVPLDNDWTYFFAGTESLDLLQELALGALTHLDELLPKRT